jgi:hypothetical protein
MTSIKLQWYRRSGERVAASKVAAVHAHAVHAKRFGYPKSQWAPPGMSSQPELADALERMSDTEWATYSGMFTYIRRELK